MSIKPKTKRLSPANEVFDAIEPELRKFFEFSNDYLHHLVLEIDWNTHLATLTTKEHANRPDE